MAYNILGVSVGHNSSVALISDGKLIYYLEEERLSKRKRDFNPFRAMIDILSKYKIDEIVTVGTNHFPEHVVLVGDGESPYYSLARKFYPEVKFTKLNHLHHLTHAASAFYNSGFTKSDILVIDGCGSLQKEDLLLEWETNSIYEGNKDTELKLKTQIYQNNLNKIGIGRVYEAVTTFLGWHPTEGGKTMGLSSYGKSNDIFPPLFIGEWGNLNFFECDPSSTYVFITKKWQKIIKKNDLYKDLAYHLQQETLKQVKNIIFNLNTNNLCCVGGYFLNCVNNYKLIKAFPDINFYFEPISHDGGTSIGAAYVKGKELNFSFNKQKTLYYGPQYSKEQLIEGIKKYV
jgi:carbamoyltransferase